MGILDVIAKIIVIIGGLNWGFTVFNFNLVETIFGTGTIVDVVYVIVGLSAIWMIFAFFRSDRR